jgi:hypothetical protein
MYKIQTLATFGWADLKCSIDGGPYELELFDTFEAARQEVRDIIDSLNGDEGEYRVVLATEKSEGDLYD